MRHGDYIGRVQQEDETGLFFLVPLIGIGAKAAAKAAGRQAAKKAAEKQAGKRTPPSPIVATPAPTPTQIAQRLDETEEETETMGLGGTSIRASWLTAAVGTAIAYNTTKKPSIPLTVVGGLTGWALGVLFLDRS